MIPEVLKTEDYNWSFPREGVLINCNQYTSPKEIFQAVCDEIGKFYQNLGFKYSRSRPKIAIKTENFDIEIAFWSSRSNMAGEHGNIEIIGHAYSKKLSVFDKAAGNTFNGFLLSHADFWEKINLINPKGTVTVYLADGTIANVRSENLNYAVDKHNCNYNIYGINEVNLRKLITYIHSIFLVQIMALDKKEGIMKFISSLVPGSTLGRENERFLKYIELAFENDKEIIELLNKKGIKK